MKIVIQSFNLAPNDIGGAEHAARELANELKALGHNLRFVLSDGSKPYPMQLDGMPIDIVAGLPIGKSPLWIKRKFLSRVLWSLRSEIDVVLLLRSIVYLRKHRPDVILMNNPAGHGSAFMLAAHWLKVPYVPILRDYGWFCAFGIMMRKGKNCEKLCASCKVFSVGRRALLRRAPETVAISEHIKKVALREGKLYARLIYDAIADDFFTTPIEKQLDAPKLCFGYLGRLHPSKGIEELLEGWFRSKLGEQGYRLQIAGDIQQGFARRDLLAAPGVIYLGRVDARTFLDGLDVLMVPALWAEPFGRTIIEGLTRRCYVVAGPRGATKELIPAGCGEILPEVNADAVAACLLRLKDTLCVEDVTRAFALQEKTLATYRAGRMISEYNTMVSEYASSSNVSVSRPLR